MFSEGVDYKYLCGEGVLTMDIMVVGYVHFAIRFSCN